MKSIKILIVAVLLITLIFPTSSTAKEIDRISEKTFLKMIKKTDSYKEFRKQIDEPLLHETIPEDGIPVGRVARYEIDYNNDENEYVKIHSYLTYAYEYETQTLSEILVDYSDLYENKIIRVHNFVNGEIEEIDVSGDETIEEYLSYIENDLENEINEAEERYQEQLQAISNGEQLGEVEPLANGQVCWRCTKTETTPHDRSTWCDYFFSIGCGILGRSKQIAKWLLCVGVQSVACWIPSYTICVDGYWSTVCPV